MCKSRQNIIMIPMYPSLSLIYHMWSMDYFEINIIKQIWIQIRKTITFDLIHMHICIYVCMFVCVGVCVCVCNVYEQSSHSSQLKCYFQAHRDIRKLIICYDIKLILNIKKLIFHRPCSQFLILNILGRITNPFCAYDESCGVFPRTMNIHKHYAHIFRRFMDLCYWQNFFSEERICRNS